MIRLHELLGRAETVVRQLEGAGIQVNPSSRLARYVVELRNAVPLDSETPSPERMYRWHRILVEIDDLSNIVHSLGTLPPTGGWQVRLRESLSGGFLRSDEVTHSRARDIQFELRLAALMRRCGYELQLTEPDIVANIRNIKVGIAVKRPRSRTKVERIAKEGAKQITELKMQGIVALDISVIANPEDRHLTSSDSSATKDIIADQAAVVGRHLGRKLLNRFGSTNVFAIITRLVVPIWVPSGILAVVNQWNITPQVDQSDSRFAICEELRDRILAAETAA